MTLAVPDAAGVADAADAQKVERAFLSMLYGGGAGAAAALAPPLALALVHTANYYGAEAIAAAAAGALASQLELTEPRPQLVAVARAVSALPDAVLELEQGRRLTAAAAALCADQLPQDLMAAWQPCASAAGDKAQVLEERDAAVIATLLTRCLETGRLCPDSAFAIAAGWADAQPGGGSAQQRRALLEAVPLGALSDNYFATAIVNSTLAAAAAPDEMHVLWLLRWAAAGRGAYSADEARRLAGALPAAWRKERPAFMAAPPADAEAWCDFSAAEVAAAAARAAIESRYYDCAPAAAQRCFAAGYEAHVALIADARGGGGAVRLVPTVILDTPFKRAGARAGGGGAAAAVAPRVWVRSALDAVVGGGEVVPLGFKHVLATAGTWSTDWAGGCPPHALFATHRSAGALVQGVAGRAIKLRAGLLVL